MNFHKVVVGLAAGILLVGCAKDRTPEDYCREKAEKLGAQIQANAGTYTGHLTANTAGGPAQGALSVVITASTMTGDMKDCPGSQVQPAVEATMSLVNSSTKLMSFTSGAYDDASGALSADANYKIPDSTEVQLHLSGTLKDGSFSGQLEIEGYPESGGGFSLARTGPAVASLPSAVLSGSAAGDSASADGEYVGTMKFSDGTSAPVTMKMIGNQGDSHAQFLYDFLPVRPVSVTIGLAQGSQAVFANVQWDQRLHRLHGELDVAGPLTGGGTSPGTVTLDCFQAAGSDGWTCRYASSLGASFEGVFNPKGGSS
jgi:hypothetical protein